jgi:Big-like domain-containing protein
MQAKYSSIRMRCGMGRWGGWIKGITLFLVAFLISCGDTGGKKSSSTGKPFVFDARARLNMVAQVAPNDSKLLYITATLLDPQGNPFRNQRVTFEAEFPDAIFVPPNPTENDILACLDRSGTGNSTRCTNRGAAITDDNGQAKVTLYAIVGPTNAPSNPDRLMRVIAEAPNSLDVATAISVPFTTTGFLIGGDLSITPPAVTFVNPLVQPGTDGPTATFTVQGGRPPYTVNNQNQALGRVTPTSLPIGSNQFVYTVVGALPTDTTGPLTDTITVTDALGATETATVTVIFADCTLNLSVATVNFGGARGEESFDIKINNGVAPFTATNTFPEAGEISIDQTTGVVTYTVVKPPVAVAPDTVTIRDSRGCVGSVEVTITPATPATIVLTASQTSICSTAGGNSTITALALDSVNKPFDGVTLLFTSPAGTTLSSPTAETGTDGKATVTLTIPPATPPGAVQVTATFGGVSGTTTVNVLDVGQGTPPCP